MRTYLELQDERDRHPFNLLFGQSGGGIEQEFAEMERDMMRLLGGTLPGMGRGFPAFPDMSGIRKSPRESSLVKFENDSIFFIIFVIFCIFFNNLSCELKSI